MERRRFWQRCACLAPEPTRNGWGSPSIIAPGQKERFLFGPRVLVFPAESQVRVSLFGTSVSVCQGSGRLPRRGPHSQMRGGVAAKEHDPKARVCDDVKDLARYLGRCGDLVSLLQPKQDEEGYLEDESRRGRDGRGHGKK